ncbi:acyl carrier protein [Streptomyces sp. NPDC091272]|uniref:acyl carrier protein n=1 Tax=Streptomyces sp. NPDC091272 TaxID=3365981 RepID=UPI0037FCE0D5
MSKARPKYEIDTDRQGQRQAMESSPSAVRQHAEQGEKSQQPNTSQAPSNAPVQEMAELWASLLDREVAPDDNFFEIGGNSLIGIQILERISQTYGVRLSVRDFYLAQSPARVAELIEPGRSRT